eukprot:CAMPEP_0202477472 /NCGR_PEP_ID=MMETSP1360-20130828/93959_1 /ASSEMBLY_ACC=CAM_ASM_000848 /TAXON_ID=515479 /ORGANISM="Licmophora paradoxa, Strain CCMP2313" /LENGTH=984 /DNA_ID=CAMNT_0049104717 /DNA_START=1310 /DNA_END=4264 /DNA_ORIENTATION=-
MTTPLTQPQMTSDQANKVKIVAGYAIQQRLGSGSFATVYRGVRVNSATATATPEGQEAPKVAAIKAIQRISEKLTKKVLENLELEISILRTYRHPNIVCLHDVQKTERHFYLILEYCGGGDVQRLIRTRKSGRLTERLTRRLMRDLSSGLKFLWSQELIHRDIKPQNLLLTGPLPLDEPNDLAKMDAHEDMRRQANFPSDHFALKIADFGFARHLQTASLAETLCGSPLYMAPEILQHQRYDAKADLWSVGAVLFEMIAGKPPFNGENHIDLLRNIQRKAVRLPQDVKVSKECVTLLRILLNRNPLARAGFREFIEACDAFVALGCEGVPAQANPSSGRQPSIKMDLGTIHESDQPAHTTGSMVTVATQAPPQFGSPPAPVQTHNPNMVSRAPTQQPVAFTTPPLGPISSPPNLVSPTEMRLPSRGANAYLAPLQPSPPQSTPTKAQLGEMPPVLPPFDIQSLQQQCIQYHRGFQTPVQSQVDPVGQNSQHSSDGDSGFVMVERSVHKFDSPSPAGNHTGAHNNSLIPSASKVRTPAPTSSFVKSSARALSRGDFMMMADSRNRRSARGMLSTSPGTGGALVGMFGLGSRQRLIQNPSGTKVSVDGQIENALKVIAAAEDVGRRAISVAHLGDNRAYVAMRMIATMGNSVLVSSTPMEGVVEDDGEEQSSANVTNDGSSDTTPIARRERSISVTDKSMSDVKEEEEEEMPFALTSDTDAPSSVTFARLPSRNSSSDLHRKGSFGTSPKATPTRPTPEMIRGRFGEALSCYLKALSMVKGVIAAAQKIKRDTEKTISSSPVTGDQVKRIHALSKRCDQTANWLSGQFSGVLERADAANSEISKLPKNNSSIPLPQMGVKELIYSQSLACGRDGAVKQLLGQYEAARACYRSAGLLIETLLMENVGSDDRKVLEGYVDGFSARITELDEILMQQSRSITSGGSTETASSNTKVVKRGSGSGVVGLIGGVQPPFVGYGHPGVSLGDD